MVSPADLPVAAPASRDTPLTGLSYTILASLLEAGTSCTPAVLVTAPAPSSEVVLAALAEGDTWASGSLSLASPAADGSALKPLAETSFASPPTETCPLFNEPSLPGALVAVLPLPRALWLSTSPVPYSSRPVRALFPSALLPLEEPPRLLRGP